MIFEALFCMFIVIVSFLGCLFIYHRGVEYGKSQVIKPLNIVTIEEIKYFRAKLLATKDEEEIHRIEQMVRKLEDALVVRRVSNE